MHGLANALTYPGQEQTHAERDLQYTLRREGAAVLLTLRGEFDIDASKSVYDDLLTTFHDPACKDLIADMSDLTFLDSSGLTVFINTMQLLNGRGGAVYMTGLHPSIRRGLTVTRLDRIFRICDTVADVQTARQLTPASQN